MGGMTTLYDFIVIQFDPARAEKCEASVISAIEGGGGVNHASASPPWMFGNF
jgi:hypothetical protein